MLAADASLGRRLADGLPMVDDLTEEQKTVATAVIKDGIQGGLPAAKGHISLILRCGSARGAKRRTRGSWRLASSIQKGRKRSSSISRKKQQTTEAASALAHMACGKKRNLTFEQRMPNLIEGETKISSALNPRCRDCAGYSTSGPCRLVKVHRLAREHPEVWHDSNGNSAASQNRRNWRSTARGTWVEPGCFEFDAQSINRRWKSEEGHRCVCFHFYPCTCGAAAWTNESGQALHCSPAERTKTSSATKRPKREERSCSELFFKLRLADRLNEQSFTDDSHAAVWGYPACHRTRRWKCVAGSNQPNHNHNHNIPQLRQQPSTTTSVN